MARIVENISAYSHPDFPTWTKTVEAIDYLVEHPAIADGGGATFQDTGQYEAEAETAMSQEALVAVQTDGIDQWGVAALLLASATVGAKETTAQAEWFGLMTAFIVMAPNASVVAPSALLVNPNLLARLTAQAGTDPFEQTLSWEVLDHEYMIPVAGAIEGTPITLAFLVFDENANVFVLRDGLGDDILCEVEDGDYLVIAAWQTWRGSTPG